MSTRSTLLVALAVLFLAALPAAAAEPILRGIDTWTTIPERTFADLRDNPIPAGFFCKDSQAFAGLIYLKGVPIMAENGVLGQIDTIVERVDDAVFNKRGVAFTRVRLRALQLTSVETFKTACGEYRVDATLDGEQPLSRMRILRENHKGGRFIVPLAVNSKLIFTRVDNEAERFEVTEHVVFPPNPLNRWAYRRFSPIGKHVAAPLVVDTDWDGTPDTRMPAQSNFAPGAFNRDAKNVSVDEISHAVQASEPPPAVE
jgi:hypothetical protein